MIDILNDFNIKTVVEEFVSTKERSPSYESEEALEKKFISILENQGYHYANDIRNEESLIHNLRLKLENLNNIKFTDKEWENFFQNHIKDTTNSIFNIEKIILSNQFLQSCQREDGSTVNIHIIDTKDFSKNEFQVINQFEDNESKNKARFDVTILINGLPVVHIELKKRGGDITEAFNQINRYVRDNFFTNSSLYRYVQIFVVSNGTITKYYANTLVEDSLNKTNKNKESVDSFAFTSFWSDKKNNIISDLIDFAQSFFIKETIFKIIFNYSVFNTDQKLLILRPYQIAATETILNKIKTLYTSNVDDFDHRGGYIWHTTGSGKTLTSFKTAVLASKLDFIDKVLFVVDRKDIDSQTMSEYNKFQNGAVNGSTNTQKLKEHLENNSDDSQITLTTIQKLNKFIVTNTKHPIYDKKVVFIFDECHRSQFGSMHDNIKKYFKHSVFFGFTGTPIFAENANNSNKQFQYLTSQLFGEVLHKYTILSAIKDENVLPFKIDYVNTITINDDVEDTKVEAINKDEVLCSDERVSLIVKYTLDNFSTKTKQNQSYIYKEKLVQGFNSIFAVSSIPMCQKYYKEFQKQIKESQNEKIKNLKIATIFSYSPNDEDMKAEGYDTKGQHNNEQISKDFLSDVIGTYNKCHGTHFDISQFNSYYTDVSKRMKDKEIDILIVVNMFLTGFDASCINTLFVDKNLHSHGLIQAFSRTNRILNSIKTFGQIGCFRNLEEETNKALELFGNDTKDTQNTVLLHSFIEYFEKGYTNQNGKFNKPYLTLIDELFSKFAIEEEIVGEQNQKDFLILFGLILKLRNILTTFDEFQSKDVLKPGQLQDYLSKYNYLYSQHRNRKEAEQTSILDDVKFEIELIKSIDINYDYIFKLIKEYKDGENDKKLEIEAKIKKSLESSLELVSKKELIIDFITKYNAIDIHNLKDSLHNFAISEFNKEFNTFNNKDKSIAFIKNSLREGKFLDIGQDKDEIMSGISLFDKDREKKRQEIVNKLQNIFDKYNGIITVDDIDNNRLI